MQLGIQKSKLFLAGSLSQHFVKTGLFAKESGHYLREAFELIQRCDYREFVEIQQEQVNEVIQHAEKFMHESRKLLTRLN